MSSGRNNTSPPDIQNNITGNQNNVERDQYNAAGDLHIHNYPANPATSSNPQTLPGVWQWYYRDNDCYQPTISLRHDAEGVAVIVSSRADIANDVYKYLKSHKLDLDILVVTNTDDPEKPVGLPPDSPDNWREIVSRFKEALAYVKKKGSRPVHFFCIGPIAMGIALGVSVGNRHNLYIYHWQNDDYHLVYEVKSGLA